MEKIQTQMEAIFTVRQIQLLKDVVLTGAWGDTYWTFKNGKEAQAYVFYLSDIREQGHFKGKTISGITNGIVEVILKEKLSFLDHDKDFFDKNESAFIFNVEELGEENILTLWANS